jgi:hypothetical protein
MRHASYSFINLNGTLPRAPGRRSKPIPRAHFYICPTITRIDHARGEAITPTRTSFFCAMLDGGGGGGGGGGIGGGG